MLSWFRKIDDAASIADVLSIARDYFATWSPEELGRLPKACRPGRVRSADDLDELHGCIVEEYRVSRATGDELHSLQKLTSFLVRAAVRLAELRRDDSAPPDEGPPSAPHKRSGAARDNN